MSATTPPPVEVPIAPHRPIIDAHHHFWGDGHPGARAFGRFLPDDLAASVVDGGHRLAATVYVDCGWAFRDTGPDHLRCVGETEYAEAVAEAAALTDRPGGKIGAAIVGRADLTMGDAVVEVIEAHLAASPTRFRGIRELLAHDRDAYQALAIPPHKARDPRFREGARHLARLGLSLDILCVHTMLEDIVELARAFPDLPIIINHLAGPIGIGRFHGKRREVLADWRGGIAELATCLNISMKLSGIGADVMGFGWNKAGLRPDSATVAEAVRPYVSAAIDAFSPARCMVGSNFPVDGQSLDYGVLWNAFKRLVSAYSPSEQDDLLRGTAARVYRLAA